MLPIFVKNVNDLFNFQSLFNYNHPVHRISFIKDNDECKTSTLINDIFCIGSNTEKNALKQINLHEKKLN